MAEFNWVTDVGVPALVAVITTVIGFSAWLTKWVEKRIEFRYDQLLAAQRRDHAAQLEMVKMLPQGLARVQDLVMTPALSVRNRLRAVHRGEGEPGPVTDEVGAAAEKLEEALETSRDPLLMFGVSGQAHAIKNSVVGVRGDLKDGEIKLEKEDRQLGEAVDELTGLISVMQERVQQWIPSPPERGQPD